MLEITVDPNKVVPWHHESTSERLVKIARAGKLDQCGRVPVYSAPEELTSLGDYVLLDGHTRRAAAIIAQKDLDIQVIENQEEWEKFFPYPVINFETAKQDLNERAKEYSKQGYLPKVLLSPVRSR